MGRAVHAVIQSVPLDPQPGVLDAFVSAQSVAEAVPDREDDVRRLAARALASGAIERAGRADRALREVPFGYEAPGGTIVEGFIDLVIDGDEGLEIVDWKTDGITESEVEDRLDQYRLQAGSMCWGSSMRRGARLQR